MEIVKFGIAAWRTCSERRELDVFWYIPQAAVVYTYVPRELFWLDLAPESMRLFHSLVGSPFEVILNHEPRDTVSRHTGNYQ